MAPRTARDSRLLDEVEALPFAAWSGRAWRVVRSFRDPLQCSAVGGRWDDRTFDVLYTSLGADGAIAEMYYHLRRGQPVVPSLAKYRLFELRADLGSCVNLRSLGALELLGLKTATFGQLSYAERSQEYPRTQEIAEAAYFHGRDGMLVPSARSAYANLVIFCDTAGVGAVEVAEDHGEIDWESWTKAPFGR
jgi:RES domain-containing protein